MRITNETAVLVRKRRAEGMRVRDIAKEFNLSMPHVSLLCGKCHPCSYSITLEDDQYMQLLEEAKQNEMSIKEYTEYLIFNHLRQ